MNSTSSPLVSICMPLYNTERFVAEAVECALAQTYRNIELIICDNCSTDRSLAIVDGYAQNDPRVRVVRNRRNLGYAGNLHKVTSLARGEFMMIQCADDLSAPTGVEKMVRLATGEGVDRDHVMVMTDFYITNAAGQPTAVSTQRPDAFESVAIAPESYKGTGAARRFKGRTALAYALPRLYIIGFQGATLYSRTLFEEIEGVYSGLNYSPDAQLNFHLLSRDPDVLWLQEPLFSWRVHEGGQIGLARGMAVPREALDAYTYTLHFSTEFLDTLGVKREELVRTFVDSFCLRTALSEIMNGSQLLAFRHLCLAMATYPRVTARSLKFYAGLVGCATGPLGRALARLGYRAGIWKESARNG